MTSAGRRANVLRANRGFRRLWAARALSSLGDGIALTALVLHVQSTYGTGIAVAALLLAQALPRLLGPLAGTAADRLEQRRLMILCDLGRAAAFGIAAATLPGLPLLLGLIAIASVLDTLFTPAGRSAVPALVADEDLLAANAWLGTALNVQVATGPLVAGTLFAVVGVRGALAVDAATFLCSAIILLGVPRLDPLRARSETAGFLAETRAGLSFVRSHPVARAVVVTLFLGVAFAAVDNVGLVFLTRDVLSAGSVGFGLAASAFGIGMLMSSIPLSGARRVPARGLFLLGWLLVGVGTLLTGLAPALWFVVVAQMLGGAGNGADNVASDTLIQRTVPRAMLGRVFGVSSTAAFVGGGLAYAAGGPLLDATSPRAVFIIGAAGTLAVVGLAWTMLPRGVERRPASRGARD
jgi:MFS family permease